MLALTPSERRGALVVVLVLLVGAGWDLVRLNRARLAPAPTPAPAAVLEGAAGQDTARGVTAPLPHPAAVNLNRASAHELERLPGIGPVLATRIVAYRQGHGPFRDPSDLIGVPGIGPALVARLAPLVTVADAARR